MWAPNWMRREWRKCKRPTRYGRRSLRWKILYTPACAASRTFAGNENIPLERSSSELPENQKILKVASANLELHVLTESSCSHHRIRARNRPSDRQTFRQGGGRRFSDSADRIAVELGRAGDHRLRRSSRTFSW